MTATHHPSDELLLAHASGGAGEAVSLIVGTHLALCPECRAKIARMEAMGGAILVDLAPAAISDHALQSVLARLDAATLEPPVPRRDGKSFTAPEPLRSYLSGDLDAVRWRPVGPGISYRSLFRGRDASAKLIRSRPGRGVGTHTHRGEELTLVLTGGFTDATGHYTRGDLQIADGALEHRPLADPGEDCIVLAVCDAPLKFRSAAVGLLGKLFGF
ncbi:MAG TPA: ChrR family anti-sigma-E factor [Rhizomicrobium sp.]|jgi:putative transcriptional regulator